MIIKKGVITIDSILKNGNKCVLYKNPIQVSVTGVTLNEKTASTSVGGTVHLTATVVPANATNQNVSWSSSE